MVRTLRDGAKQSFGWDASLGLYTSTEGGGAYERVSYDSAAAQFVWHSSANDQMETYDAGAGQLLQADDLHGNSQRFTYANGLLISVANKSVGDSEYRVNTEYSYNAKQLAQVQTRQEDGSLRTRVRYDYDSSGRLWHVSVDLSPEDGSTADGFVYVTTYSYDGASQRVSNVTQSDGSSLTFVYVKVGVDYRVQSVKDGLGNKTSFDYSQAGKTCTPASSRRRTKARTT
ncbi:hypothetical protein DBR47_03375 [Paucibacter sp. KBW04]|nr:hypothetical protein DBR47_03375 [Paucibacter sp. KBW04]